MICLEGIYFAKAVAGVEPGSMLLNTHSIMLFNVCIVVEEAHLLTTVPPEKQTDLWYPCTS